MSRAGVVRGAVVIVDFAPLNPALGVRPALVIQNDRDNGRMSNTIVAQITSNTSRAHESTQLLIEDVHPDWRDSGLRRSSVVNCSNIVCVQQRSIARVIGRLSPTTMRQVDDCLKAALGIA